MTSELTRKGFFFPKRVFILKPIVTSPDCDKTPDSDKANNRFQNLLKYSEARVYEKNESSLKIFQRRKLGENFNSTRLLQGHNRDRGRNRILLLL